ncbi:MAG TPA: hypothetical protein VD927_06605 [Chryseosolibacter sp.]|nr:hypothetical protein [Chryseosolibacter sp.]
MAKQSINIGTTANDRTGDNLRDAFDKVNDNTDELYTKDTEHDADIAAIESDVTSIESDVAAVESDVATLEDKLDIDVESFATELTFDEDKDLATQSGGTTTFTLAASGHVNGVGIVARINEPVAVNFPAGFEALNGSDSISTTDMNIIVFRYFENYDGAGNGKVLYTIKNQTAV